MSVEFIKHAFIAGELSPSLFGRTDLTKYDLGMALAKNWFVDYRGGLSTRAGLEFGDFIRDDHLNTKFFQFRFSPDLIDTYVILFGHNYVRFIQDNAYVLTDALTVTDLTNGVATATAHGLSTKNTVKLSGFTTTDLVNGRTFDVEVLTTDTFQLIDPLTRENFLGSATSSGSAAPVYEVETGYSSDNLEKLSAFQIRDSLRLTHPEHPIRNLTRLDHDDWKIELEEIGSSDTVPSGVAMTPSSSGDLSAIYAVSAVLEDGRETLPSYPALLKNSVNFTTGPGSVKIAWSAVPGAVSYIIYRSHITTNNNIPSAGSQLGFLGTTKGTFFVDSNIIPDFTKGPYEHYNPFAIGSIETVTIDNAGTGYKFLAPITISGGGGSGFRGYAIVADDGTLTNTVIVRAGEGYVEPLTVTVHPSADALAGGISSITITNGGSGYTSTAAVSVTGDTGSGFVGTAIADVGEIVSVTIWNTGSGYSGTLTVTITGGGGTGATGDAVLSGGGSGATADATISPTEGLYPSISVVFQQRQVYAASLQYPLTLWASQIGHYNNFDSSVYIIDSDSYEFEIDSAEIAPILHAFSMRGGLLLLSQTGAWLLTGGSSAGAVTPSNALADPQAFDGSGPVPPLKIGSDLLYVEGKGFSVRLLSYNDFSKVYSGEDRSILSNHLFGKTHYITSWTFADNPYKLVYGVRSDGALVMFTVVKEQDVFAWTWGTTRGFFKDIICIPESELDRVYVVVERTINGHTRKFFERFSAREIESVEDTWAVDAGLSLATTPQSTTLTVTEEEPVGTVRMVRLVAGSSVFTGKEEFVVRAAGGVFYIDEVVSGTEALARVSVAATKYMPEQPDVIYISKSNEWTMDEAVMEVSGLWHLEGEEVTILADGNVMPAREVEDGAITLDYAASKIVVGLPYTCIAQTLPPTTQELPIEAKRKRTVGVAARFLESRGVKHGTSLDKLYELKERTNEVFGAPTRLINGFRYQLLEGNWEEDAQVYIVQDNPLPVTLLGLIPDMEIGDDTD